MSHIQARNLPAIILLCKEYNANVIWREEENALVWQLDNDLTKEQYEAFHKAASRLFGVEVRDGYSEPVFGGATP